MYGFCEKLRLKGMAEEDIYFARRDRELIAALKLRAEAGQCKLALKKREIKVDVDERSNIELVKRNGERSG